MENMCGMSYTLKRNGSVLILQSFRKGPKIESGPSSLNFGNNGRENINIASFSFPSSKKGLEYQKVPLKLQYRS